ncbi:MAG: ribosome biogenesis domain-containing protein [Thermoplasmata archaeon]
MPNPAEGTIPLYLRFAGEDHPKACTGRKLRQRGLLSVGLRGERGSVLLDPHAPHPLSASDTDRARRAGLLAVDCSWNQLGDRGGYPTSSGTSGRGHRRRLPYLLAGNPQHYGRMAELNTAEALAAALWILGERERAQALLAGFSGGTEFFRINHTFLGRYATCADADEIRTAERDLFGSKPRG